MTISHRGSNWQNCRRTASRIRRFTRFRSTDLPNDRGTVKPIFEPPACACRRQNAAKYGPVTRIPSA